MFVVKSLMSGRYLRGGRPGGRREVTLETTLDKARVFARKCDATNCINAQYGPGKGLHLEVVQVTLQEVR